MHFLLIHSPLVTKETWAALDLSLTTAGFGATVVDLDNRSVRDAPFYEHHLSQINSALSDLRGERIVAVAHSGAGNLLGLIDPDRIEYFVFLDATFPSVEASRFTLFNDPDVVSKWKEVAKEHGGMLPKSMLARFGEQIANYGSRIAFLSELTDVPIAVYEEIIPVHRNWPSSSRGLYLQWTDSYSADAARAAKAGFEVHVDSASHFKVLNQPDEVAHSLIRFVNSRETKEIGMEKEVSQLLNQLYPDFNERNIEQILSHFAVDADWPNGMTGGREIGHQAIREYWANQWTVINSKVTPISYRVVGEQIILEVHQLVKDMEGKTLSDSVVYHTYRFVDGKITKMDISVDVPKFGASMTASPA